MSNGMSFIEGATFADMMHHTGQAVASERALNQTLDLIKQINDLKGRIREDYETIADANNRADAREGVINLTNEEVDLREMGIVDHSKGRMSARNTDRDAVKEELVKLAAKVDQNLAARGGRFSGRRVDNLREVLHMRIDEFFEYGKEHRLIHPDAKRIYDDEIRAAMYQTIAEKSKSIGDSQEAIELLLLQMTLNKNYVLAADDAGNKPEDYPYKPVNLIAAVGLTVKQLCEAANIEEDAFVGRPLADPPFDRKEVFDSANDEAAQILQIDYAQLETEADAKILASKALEKPEDMVARINESIPDDKARVAAKISVVKYLDLQAQLGLGTTSPAPGA